MIDQLDKARRDARRDPEDVGALIRLKTALQRSEWQTRKAKAFSYLEDANKVLEAAGIERRLTIEVNPEATCQGDVYLVGDDSGHADRDGYGQGDVESGIECWLDAVLDEAWDHEAYSFPLEGYSVRLDHEAAINLEPCWVLMFEDRFTNALGHWYGEWIDVDGHMGGQRYRTAAQAAQRARELYG